MFKNKAVILFIISFLLAGNFLIGQEKSTVYVIAQNKEKKGEFVFAWGNAEIHYNDIKLFADWLELNAETKDVHARGDVTIHLPDEFLSAEEVYINLDSSKGELKEALGRVQPSIVYEANEIERNNESVYSLRKAKITSCTQPNPRWRLSASRANFKKNDYIEMWNTVLSIKKVPVFYFPYFRYPLGKERATGFLMPQLGYTGHKGFNYTQSFYWGIKRNMDATLTADYYSAKGIGGGAEYRYMFSRGIRGQLNLYRFQFNKEPDQAKSSGAYVFRFNHKQTLPLNFSLIADVDYNSSFEFVREFDNDFKRAVASNRRSQLYLSKSWSYFNFNARISRYETFYREKDVMYIRNSFPEISFRSSQIRLFSAMFFSFKSSLTRWEFGREIDYQNDRQKQSQSASFQPQLTFPFTPIPWITLNSSVYSNLTYHFQSYAPGTSEVVDEPLFIPEYGLNVELIGPVFYKIFRDAQGEAKLKHIIEPNFSFRYENPIDDPDRIIDYRRYRRYHLISYGLVNRVLVKTRRMPREVFALGLMQMFYLSPEDSPLSLYRVDGEIPERSDISGYLRFYPVRKYSLDVSGAFNPYSKRFSHLRLGARYGSRNDNVFFRIDWYKSTNPYSEEVTVDRHHIGFYGGIKMPRLSMDAEVELDYDIKEKGFVYSGLNLVYHYQCLDIKAEVKVFYFRERPETQFNISIGFGNIGKTVGFFSGLEF